LTRASVEYSDGLIEGKKKDGLKGAAADASVPFAQREEQKAHDQGGRRNDGRIADDAIRSKRAARDEAVCESAGKYRNQWSQTSTHDGIIAR
jgi:hypothetical protein